MKNKKQQHLGVDIGRVIMAPVRDGQPDTSFLTGILKYLVDLVPFLFRSESRKRVSERPIGPDRF